MGERKTQQVAFDGVRTVWREQHPARFAAHEEPAVLSIDGVVVKETVHDVATQVLRRDTVRALSVQDHVTLKTPEATLLQKIIHTLRPSRRSFSNTQA